MTINLLPDSATIAHFAMRLQYDDINSAAAMIDFAHSFDRNLDIPIRAALIDIIDLDISDMLHNSNLDFYATLDEIDALSDDQFDALSDHLLASTDPAKIADAILTKTLRDAPSSDMIAS